MAGRTSLFRTSICPNCLRRTVQDDISQSFFPFYRQLRGKKKTSKGPTTINVKLLQDMPGYGRKDSITPVEPGRMRNSWYPRQKAAYMTAATLQGVKPQAVVAERDFTFGIKAKKEETPEALQEEKPAEVNPKFELPSKLLPPLDASKILETALPSQIIFYRTPIPEAEHPAPEPVTNPRRRATSAAAELDAASEPTKPSKPRLTTIFGSVSTADIAESIKAVLAQTKEGARVVVGPEDINIVVQESALAEDHTNGIEGDRIKALGDFQVEIRVKGAETVARTVSVTAQDDVTESS